MTTYATNPSDEDVWRTVLEAETPLVVDLRDPSAGAADATPSRPGADVVVEWQQASD